MKRLALILLVCAGCKSDKPAPAPAPSDDQPAPRAQVAHTGPRPMLPPNEQEGADRPALPDEDRPWRHRHHHGSDGSDGWGSGWGSATPEQREAFRKQRIDDMRSRMDANGDGKLSYDELQNAPGRMHFDDPAAIDTNHDGDISADELEAAMQARRDAFRAQRAARNGGDPNAPQPPPADPNAQPPQ